ncbi:hypothetical protein Tco_0020096 [Tanacetum coccineum]
MNSLDTYHLRKRRKKKRNKRRKKRKRKSKKRRNRRRRKKWGQTSNLQVMQHSTMKRNQISSPMSEPKCKEMEDTCDSGVRPKPDSS